MVILAEDMICVGPDRYDIAIKLSPEQSIPKDLPIHLGETITLPYSNPCSFKIIGIVKSEFQWTIGLEQINTKSHPMDESTLQKFKAGTELVLTTKYQEDERKN